MNWSRQAAGEGGSGNGGRLSQTQREAGGINQIQLGRGRRCGPGARGWGKGQQGERRSEREERCGVEGEERDTEIDRQRNQETAREETASHQPRLTNTQR